MKTHVLRGSNNEIAASIVGLAGTIREVIVFIEEPLESLSEPTQQDLFAEMEPFTVHVGNADDSRESLYARMENE